MVRWVTTEQARRYMMYDQIRPSWQHFVPQIGKARTGICFDMMTTSNWRESSKRIGFVIDKDDLPSGSISFEIDGNRVFNLTERLRWMFDKTQIRDVLKEIKANLAFYTQDVDELFVLGTIDKLGSRLKGVIALDTGRRMGPKCEAELMEFTTTNRIPLLNVKVDEFSSLKNDLRNHLQLVMNIKTAAGESLLQMDMDAVNYPRSRSMQPRG